MSFNFNRSNDSTSSTLFPTSGSYNSSGFSQISQNSLNNASSASKPAASQNPSTIVAQHYEQKFRGIRLFNEIKTLAEASCSDSLGGELAGQQLSQIICNRKKETDSSSTLLLAPKTLTYCQPDVSLRRRLAEHPVVTVTASDQKQHETTLTTAFLEDICLLSDSLYISEEDALSLYHYLSTSHEFLDRIKKTPSMTESSQKSFAPNDFICAAQQFYYHERSMNLKTILILLQYRQNSYHVAKATNTLVQSGLFTNLITFIREATTIIDQLQQKYLNAMTDISSKENFFSTSTVQSSKSHQQLAVVKQHLQFYFKERQIASECLFFTAYDVQLTPNEVVSLLDLIKDASNGTSPNSAGLRILNPYTDVPDPYEHSQVPSSQQAQAFIGSGSDSFWSHQLREKEALTWKQELVDCVHKTGCPELLRCVGVLVMTCVAALSTSTILIDRHTHEPNTFGMGNALLPPETFNTDALHQINVRLSKDASKTWKRCDIFGLLLAAYTNLLRPAAMSAPSPHSNQLNNRNEVDIRKSYRECLGLPAEFKSYTFARSSLIPALQKSSDITDSTVQCDIADFLLSILADFASCILETLCSSGERPISRAKWEQEAEDALRLQRTYEEQQQKFHGQFHVAPNLATESSGASLLEASDRPDCIDDIIAFATEVCSLKPDYALRFWSQELQVTSNSQEEKLTCLRPSCALRDIQMLQLSDQSLRPAYLFFLAALAHAKDDDSGLNGAATISDYFSNISTNNIGLFKESWGSVMETFRHYIRELKPNFSNARTSSRNARQVQLSNSSSAYYYLDEGSSTNDFREHSVDINIPAARELGEENTSIILSHLALITSISQNYPEARAIITQTSLPIYGPDQREVRGQDGTLNILFTLSVMPLHPDVRGMVFKTIASILSIDGLPDKSAENEALKFAAIGWDLMETCQILPIHSLEQLQITNRNSDMADAGLSFPPSTLTLVSDRSNTTWIPRDPRYSILYEMEFVEASIGYYPSTEGFLCLLKSLFITGCSQSRRRSDQAISRGASPYMEYIMNLVLPRAIGSFMNLPRLPFRSNQDFNRLISLALDVIESALSRYCLFSYDNESLSYQQASFSVALHELGCDSLAQSVIIPSNTDDMLIFQQDFCLKSKDPVEQPDSTSRLTLGSPLLDTLSDNDSFPYNGFSQRGKKSAGFLILSDILSPSGGSLIKTVVTTLTQARTSQSEAESDRFALAFALYCGTTPTILSAKEGSRSRNSSTLYQALHNPLFSVSDSLCSTKSSYWKGRAVYCCLKLLCSTIARENFWRNCILSSKNPLTIVPTLNFHRSTVPISNDVRCSKLSQRLLSMDKETAVILTVIRYVMAGHSNESFDIQISTAATAILFYLERSFNPKQVSDFIYNHIDHSTAIAKSFGRCIMSCIESPLSQERIDLLKIILNHHLTTLRSTSLSKPSLTHVMLGLPLPLTAIDAKTPNTLSSLDGIIALLKNSDLLISNETSCLFSSCFEIIFRLTQVQDESLHMKTLGFISKRLRDSDFWKSQVRQLSYVVPSIYQPDNVELIHSLAWFLKGISSELVLTSGNIGNNISNLRLNHLFHPQPLYNEELCSIMFKDDGFINAAITKLPLEMVNVDRVQVPLSEDAIRQSKMKLPGALEIVGSFELVDIEKLIVSCTSELNTQQQTDVKVWAMQWNLLSSLDCASAHLSNALCIFITVVEESIRSTTSVLSGYHFLTSILSRLIGGRDNTRKDHSFDYRLYPLASRNLSFATLMATRLLRVNEKVDNDCQSDLANCCSLLAKAISLSGTNNVQNSVANVRTSFLACSLISILPSVGNGSLMTAFQSDFLEATFVLATLGGCLTSGDPSEIPTRLNLIGRAALSVILDVFGNDFDSSVQNFYVKALKRITPAGTPVLKSVVAALPLFDSDVAILLSKIACIPQGVDLIYDCGALLELENIAQDFFHTTQTNINGTNNSEASELNVPSYLASHLTLLNSMMAFECNTQRKIEVANTAINALVCYQKVLEYLINEFPLDLDVLYAAFQCISFVKEIYNKSNLHTQSYIVPAVCDYASSLGSDFELKVCELCMEIAMNPLPIDLIRDSSLDVYNSKGKSNFYGLFETKQVWWDFLRHGTNRAKTGDLQCSFESYDILLTTCSVIDVLLAGFFITRGSSSSLHIKSSLLCESYCKCMEALTFVDSRLRTLKHSAQSEFSIEVDILTNLKIKLSAAITYELFHMSDRLCLLKLEGQHESFAREVGLSLERAGLQTKLSIIPEENQVNTIQGLILFLQKESQGVPF